MLSFAANWCPISESGEQRSKHAERRRSLNAAAEVPQRGAGAGANPLAPRCGIKSQLEDLSDASPVNIQV